MLIGQTGPCEGIDLRNCCDRLIVCSRVHLPTARETSNTVNGSRSFESTTRKRTAIRGDLAVVGELVLFLCGVFSTINNPLWPSSVA